jgi:hypothetical protein
MTWAGFELLGVFCLCLSRLLLTGFLPAFQQALTAVGLLASQCFTFSIAAKAVYLAVLIGHAWKVGKIDSSGQGVDLVIDGLNVLSLIVGMISTVVGQALFGTAPFHVSPTAATALIVIISVGFLRRRQMHNVILVDVFGSLCLLTTWWMLYYESAQRMLRVDSALHRDLGWPVGGESFFAWYYPHHSISSYFASLFAWRWRSPADGGGPNTRWPASSFSSPLAGRFALRLGGLEDEGQADGAKGLRFRGFGT